MAVDKLVDSTQLDADLTSVANAIRAKGGTSAQLAFPAEFVSAIEAISGGGGLTLLASGDYVVSSDIGTGSMAIPVSVNGKSQVILCVKDTPRSGSGQTFAWVRFSLDSPPEIQSSFGIVTEMLYTSSTTSTYYAARSALSSYPIPLQVDVATNTTKLYAYRYSNNYPIKADTYHWYIWGTEE